ncbi:hypothetical protein HPB47_002319 [Ixodes persulcatus]|uniref:Uncharacterized protein n=1 Tax=Ixodes persulcatus TaxID=34615 RepID=A0AC60PLN9_IXOPE|nr:hypothetical protein HPB47_002319 [Ixodes persulcatus]
MDSIAQDTSGASLKGTGPAHQVRSNPIDESAASIQHGAMKYQAGSEGFQSINNCSLRDYGLRLGSEHAAGTAEFLKIVERWWSIVNVKTCNKGRRLRDDLQSPVMSMSGPQIEYLTNVIKWLDLWQSLKFDTGRPTPDTHSALRLTTSALVKLTSYCFQEIGFDHVMLGKFQTNSLEDRFGKYRQLASAQYHVSIRQILESERKLRLQKVLQLPDMEVAASSVEMDASVLEKFRIEVKDMNFANKVPNLPAITYMAGYCAHAALKKLSCTACRANLVLGHDIQVENSDIIRSMNRVGLEFPQPAVADAVVTTEIVLDKLRSEKYATQFHGLPSQTAALLTLTHNVLDDSNDLDVCDNGYSPQLVMRHILSAATNIVLNNYCETKNDQLVLKKLTQKRKMKTLKH